MFLLQQSSTGEKEEEEEGFLVPLSTRVGFPANYHVYEKCKKISKISRKQRPNQYFTHLEVEKTVRIQVTTQKLHFYAQ